MSSNDPMPADADTPADPAADALDELERLRRQAEFTRQWYAERWERLRALFDGTDLEGPACSIMANGTASHDEPPTYAEQMNVLRHRAEAAERERDALRRAVEGLPLTADGVAIVPGGNLFAVVEMNVEPVAREVIPCGFVEMKEEGGTVRDSYGNEYDVDYDACYSTMEAARQALAPGDAGAPGEGEEKA